MGMFEVDPKGLRKLLAGRDYGFVINELAQNAFDEEGVTELAIEVRPVEGKRQVQVLVSDNSPNGFRRLSDAWTLFAESYKKGNPLQRGRFDLGEKLVISLCKRAEIVTTTGAVRFENNKRSTLRRKREQGTLVSLWIPATKAQHEELLRAAHRLIPPAGVTVTLNGVNLHTTLPIRTFKAKLPTVNVDEEGQLRPSERIAEVQVYEAVQSWDNGQAWLYEMGIPVVPIKATWTLDVQQKIPLNMDRDNVTPSFRRKLYAHTLNAMAQELPKEDAAKPWVVEGTGAKEIEPETMSTVFDKSMGEKRVIYDPSDPEANMKAVSKGHTLVRGNQLSEGQRQNMRRFREAGHDPLPPAGRLFPSPKPYGDDPNGPPVEVIPPSKYTERQKEVVAMAKDIFGQIVTEAVGELSVRIVNTTNSFVACFGSGRMDLNVKRLGHSFFDGTDQKALERVLRIFVHEFAHHYSGNHLAEAYHDGLTRLGVRLSTRVERGVYRRYGYQLS